MTRLLKQRATGGFSLIEILIGVLVLGLSLLGLAAVFPAVVREQRIARDTIVGKTVERSAETYLTTRGNLGRPGNQGAWSVWSENVSARPDARKWSVSLGNWVGGGYSNAGVITFLTGNPIRPMDRLWPLPDQYGKGDQPQFIWDFAACLMDDPPAGGGNDNQLVNGPIRLAIFSRRVDQQIRLARGASLIAAFDNDNDEIIPLACKMGTGEPQLNGLWIGGQTRYAPPITAEVTDCLQSRGGNNPYDILVLAPTPTGLGSSVTLARKLGQRLVDNVGTIYTVIDVPTASGQTTRVKVEPNIPSEVVKNVRSGQPAREVQVVFTPQIPASVKLIQIRP